MKVLGAIVVALVVMLFVFVFAMFLVCFLAVSMESVNVAWLGGILSAVVSLCAGYLVVAGIIKDDARLTDERHAKSAKALRSMVDVYDVRRKPDADEDCDRGSADSPEE